MDKNDRVIAGYIVRNCIKDLQKFNTVVGKRIYLNHNIECFKSQREGLLKPRHFSDEVLDLLIKKYDAELSKLKE